MRKINTGMLLVAFMQLHLPAYGQADTNNEDGWLEQLTVPGPAHKVLDSLIGDWEGEIRTWDNPGSEATRTRMHVRRGWVLSGHFIRENFTIKDSGDPFEGLGYIGYSNLEGRYQLIWMDNEETSISISTGRFDPDSKTLTTLGNYREASTGYVIGTRLILNMADPDVNPISGYTTREDGKEFKSLEGVLRRKR